MLYYNNSDFVQSLFEYIISTVNLEACNKDNVPKRNKVKVM